MARLIVTDTSNGRVSATVHLDARSLAKWLKPWWRPGRPAKDEDQMWFERHVMETTASSEGYGLAFEVTSRGLTPCKSGSREGRSFSSMDEMSTCTRMSSQQSALSRGYDVDVYDVIAADGTVYRATLDGPEWGTVSLVPTTINQLDQLIHLLRAEAAARHVTIPQDATTPDTIWRTVLAAEDRARSSTRSWKR